MKTRIIAVMLLIAGLAVGYFVYASQFKAESALSRFPFKLGLDLNGGSHLVYKADISKVAPGDVSVSMDALRDTIERRVNLFGVSEPLVQVEQGGVLGSKEASQKLIVELPGVTDIDEAIKLIGATPTLEFMVLKSSDMTALQNKTDLTEEQKQAELAKLFVPTGLTGRLLQKAQVEFLPNTNEPAVSLQFNDEGRALFAQITKAHVGDILAIFLDGQPISLPVVRQEIADGHAQISGGFALDEAKTLVRNLNYGALPVPIELISTQTVGASLGEKAVQGSIKAGEWALIVIALFLILWYRLPGLLAVVSLGIYTVIMLALFKLIPVTLTEAGIAGFILSIGMAVDANILIFERMKEEFRNGRSIYDGAKEGFHRAWLSIRDSNSSSLITGAILYYFGSSAIIRGFALVFIIGVLVSMFTAITVSRTFLFAIVPKKDSRLARFFFNNGFNFTSNK